MQRITDPVNLAHAPELVAEYHRLIEAIEGFEKERMQPIYAPFLRVAGPCEVFINSHAMDILKRLKTGNREHKIAWEYWRHLGIDGLRKELSDALFVRATRATRPKVVGATAPTAAACWDGIVYLRHMLSLTLVEGPCEESYWQERKDAYMAEIGHARELEELEHRRDQLEAALADSVKAIAAVEKDRADWVDRKLIADASILERCRSDPELAEHIQQLEDEAGQEMLKDMNDLIAAKQAFIGGLPAGMPVDARRAAVAQFNLEWAARKRQLAKKEASL